MTTLPARVAVVSLLVCAACSGDKSNPVANTPPTPPPVVTHTLTGVVGVTGTLQTIPNATVTVIDGPNPGRNATTDGNGRYTIAGLTQAGFNVQAVAAGYNAQARGVNLTADTQTNFSLLPTAFFTRSGVGDTVFDLPGYVSRVRIVATPGSSCQNFVVKIATRLIVNVILGTCSVADARTHDGTYVTTGGVTEVTISSGVAWTFTEVR